MPGNQNPKLENLDSMELPALLTSVAFARWDVLQSQIEASASAIQEKNQILVMASMFLAELRVLQDKKKSIMSGKCKMFFQEHGIAVSINSMDGNIDNIQNFIDSITSVSQMDLIELNALMNKYNEFSEMFSGLMQKFNSPIKM